MIRGSSGVARVFVPEPEPPPVINTLPFAEASLRTGYKTLTTANVSPTTSSITLDSGFDYLIDLGMIQRDRALKIWVKAGQRVKVQNVYINSTVAPGGALSPYWRGGIGFRMASGQASGAEHCSLTNALMTGPYLTDGLTIGSGADPAIAKVTFQNVRVEAPAVLTGSQSAEPAEHCDAFQMQGQADIVEFGLCTFYANDVALPNHPGKGWMLNDYSPAGYAVVANKVNFRDVSGGTNCGAFIIQDIRAITVDFTDCYAKVEKASGGSYQWTTGSSLFLHYGSALTWTSSGLSPYRVASFDAASGFTGTVSEGLPATGTDYVTRAGLGL